jgi:hypothetical protein
MDLSYYSRVWSTTRTATPFSYSATILPIYFFIYHNKLAFKKTCDCDSKHGVKSGRKTFTYPNHIHTCP